MNRVAAWLVSIAVVAMAGCAAPERSRPFHSTVAQAAALPETVAVEDGKGQIVHLRLAEVVEGGVLVSGFGWRREHPMGGGGATHAGIDIKAPRGTAVRPAATGTIVERSWGADFGRFVRVRHSDRLETIYAHLTRFAKPLEVGQTVTPADIIGYIGSTGRSTGPHLHFEVRRNGKAIDPLGIKPASAKPARKAKERGPPTGDVGAPAKAAQAPPRKHE